MSKEKVLTLIDKSKPTAGNLEKIKQKIISVWGSIEDAPCVIEDNFLLFETSVKIAGKQ